MVTKLLTKPEKWILWGILVLSLVGSAFHFIYELSGNNVLIGIISPINESVWEHNKLVLWPMVTWWTVYFIVMSKKRSLNPHVWFTALLGAVTSSMVFMVSFFYTYSGALGVENLLVDIVVFFLSIIVGQMVGLWLYRRGKRIHFLISFGVIMVLLAVFTLFTFVHPNLPIFIPHHTK